MENGPNKRRKIINIDDEEEEPETFAQQRPIDQDSEIGSNPDDYLEDIEDEEEEEGEDLYKENWME